MFALRATALSADFMSASIANYVMRSLMLSVLCIIAAPSAVHAQYYTSCNSTYGGGYNCYNSQGGMSTVRQAPNGNYNVYYQSPQGQSTNCQVRYDSRGNVNTYCY